MNKKLPAVLFLWVLAFSAGAQSENQDLPGPHKGAVSVVLPDGEGRILSAGEDGFLNIWDPASGRAVGRFQLSSFSITGMAKRPGQQELALIETDGMGLYRISVWNYAERNKLFTLRFRDPVSFAGYSAGGGFLMVGRSGRTPVVFLDPQTGDQLEAPVGLTGNVSFAATGRSERTMVCYSPSGILSYWNLESGEEVRTYRVPENLKNPILFSNNRFFAGYDSQGLSVLDATSGILLARSTESRSGLLVASGGESAEFISEERQGNTTRVLRYGVRENGSLEIKNRRALPSSVPSVSSSALSGEDLILGGSDGLVRIVDGSGSLKTLGTRSQYEIHEGAVSGNTLAVLNRNGSLALLPLDYRDFSRGMRISFTAAGAYNRIAGDPNYQEGEEETGSRGPAFLLWNSENTRSSPSLRFLSGPARNLSSLALRFNLRSVSVLGNRALFLDVMGNVFMVSLESGDIVYRYSSLGSLDAVFADEKTIILGRSGASTPFLMVNTESGETVPLSYPSDIGARLYRGSDTAIYAAVVDQASGELKTSVILLDTADPPSSQRLLEYQGEDTAFGLAECSGALATTLGGDGATLFSHRGFSSFERSPGLPEKLIGGRLFIIAIDDDGSIIWHDKDTGAILASLRLYRNEWILDFGEGSPEESPLRGSVTGIR
ncbi:MAG: WD40 repeat domain-containing protein [Spirochaetaceae bacterium]|jgi:WD40 repeat protein|nr:WD40 repeat domain-containing protein [Spirochaetaceae bacterium]